MHFVKVQTSQRGLLTQSNTRVFSSFGIIVLLLTTITAAKAERLKLEDLTGIKKGSEGTQNTRWSTRSELCSVVSRANEAPAAQGPDSTASTKKAIVGSWIETVTFSGAGAPPPLKSLVTFAADGTVTVADQGNVNLAAGQLFSAGHGSWTALGDRTFAWTVLELISDLNGNLLGTLKVKGTYTVADSGNAYTGQFHAEITDIFGNVFPIDGTNEGQRIQVELLP